jgi:hypothetical protein
LRKQAIAALVRSLRKRCVRCGIEDPDVLEFHHKDPSQKLAHLGAASTRSWGVERVRAEVAKCDVLCANCHRKLEANLRRARSEPEALSSLRLAA